MLKNPECKKYIPYSEFKATLFFSASAKLLKNPECKKYIQYSENFPGKLFTWQAQVAQKSWL